jgi:hypothetical protein
MIAAGVAAGATIPYHGATAKPGNPCSATVARSGAFGVRVAPAAASRRSVPAFACGSTGEVREHEVDMSADDPTAGVSIPCGI